MSTHPFDSEYLSSRENPKIKQEKKKVLMKNFNPKTIALRWSEISVLHIELIFSWVNLPNTIDIK